MLAAKRPEAEVQLIFVSDDKRGAQTLAKRFDVMSYRIYFHRYSSDPSNINSICGPILFGQPFLPTAILIDYFCEDGRCKDVLLKVSRAVPNSGVELVVYNVPDCAETREALLAWGADTIVEAEAPLVTHDYVH